VLKNMPCELLEFSPHGVLLYFRFSRISSAVMPDDSRRSGTVLATLGMGHMDNDTDRIMYDFRLV